MLAKQNYSLNRLTDMNNNMKHTIYMLTSVAVVHLELNLNGSVAM